MAEALQTHTMLTQTQRLAVQQAAHAPVMLLTGAAGCGKTYTTQVSCFLLVSLSLLSFGVISSLAIFQSKMG